jgi:hypothetical protein
VTGAAGRIAYSLIPLLCSGSVAARTLGLNLDSVTLRPQGQGHGVLSGDSGCYHHLVDEVAGTFDAL